MLTFPFYFLHVIFYSKSYSKIYLLFYFTIIFNLNILNCVRTCVKMALFQLLSLFLYFILTMSH